jgi:hypothetical protein
MNARRRSSSRSAPFSSTLSEDQNISINLDEALNYESAKNPSTEPNAPLDGRRKLWLIAMCVLAAAVVLPWVYCMTRYAMGDLKNGIPTEYTALVSVIIALFFSNDLASRLLR